MINLITSYYKDSNQDRRKEIDYCFYKNSILSNVNFVVLESQTRVKFCEYFDYLNKITNPDDVNIVCNSDVYFESEILLSEKIKDDQAFALSRWDLQNDGTLKFFDRPDSQDAWVFRGKIRNVYSDFYMGYRGCDNRLAYELAQSGYSVFNPSKTLKSIHVHTSNIRNYTYNDKLVVPGPYKSIDTRYLEEVP